MNRIHQQDRVHERMGGFSFIDVLVGIALMSIVFFALMSAFRYSLVLLGIAKTEITAIALANEQMEYIRSIDYNSVGTAGGIPAGAIAQTETVTLNNVTYIRRTLVQYEDASEDGSGGADQNALTADYKRVKVEVSWYAREVPRTYSLITTIVPKGVESVSGGGTLRIYVVSALGSPIEDAMVRIRNASTTPPIDVTVYTNAQGRVEFPGGTPAASGYTVTVSKAGYSSEQTYDVTPGNPNPLPGHLTVVVGGTTSSTFGIDRVGGAIIKTWSPIQDGTWSDTFADTGQTSLLSSTTVSGGRVELSIDPSTSDYYVTGEVHSETIAPGQLVRWNSFVWDETKPVGTEILYRVYYWNGSAFALIPDTDLPGNALGATTSPISLTSLATTTYSSLRLSATLLASVGSTTPLLRDWSLEYQGGPTPLPNIAFTLQGAKTIGTDGGGAPVYKYTGSGNTGVTGSVSVPALEWDNYAVGISTAGYDIAEACTPLPMSVTPGATTTLSLTLVPETSNSLLISVRDTGGALIGAAGVRLYGGAFDTTLTSSSCGQVFFGNLSSVTTYTLEVTKAGFQTATVNPVDVSGAQTSSVILTP